jgi:hypothetical protein
MHSPYLFIINDTGVMTWDAVPPRDDQRRADEITTVIIMLAQSAHQTSHCLYLYALPSIPLI